MRPCQVNTQIHILFILITDLFCVHVCMCGRKHIQATMYEQRSEDNIRELSLSFHNTNPLNKTKALRLDGRWLCSHTDLQVLIFSVLSSYRLLDIS